MKTDDKNMKEEQTPEQRYTEETGKYIVQVLSQDDVESATGNVARYTPEQMQDLRDELEDYTYDGDDWSTCINKFNDNQ